LASLAYVKSVKSGSKIHSPDPSDPIDAQQVFVDSAVMEHSTRLLGAGNPNIELPHVMLDCQEKLMERIMKKCMPMDTSKGMSIALLGGIQVNTPEGTPDYFLPKKFSLVNDEGKLEEDLLSLLVEEGNKDLTKVVRQKRTEEKPKGEEKCVDVPLIY